MCTKLLVFFFVQIFWAFDYRGEVGINLPSFEFDSVKWHEDKADALLKILQSVSSIGNVTLIGWQDIYNTDGTLKEIRTIELTSLYNSTPGISTRTLDFDFFSGLPEIASLGHDLQSTTGILLTASFQQWHEDGIIENFLFLNQDQSAFVLDGDVLFGVVNITVPNVEAVNSFVKLLEGQTNVPMSVLKYVQGEVDTQNSSIVPHLLGSVKKMENATDAMIETALASMSQAVLKNSKVSKNIALDMKKKFPDYLWYVAEEVYEFLVNPADVSIDLEYLFFDVAETRSLKYSIYGQKL